MENKNQSHQIDWSISKDPYTGHEGFCKHYSSCHLLSPEENLEVEKVLWNDIVFPEYKALYDQFLEEEKKKPLADGKTSDILAELEKNSVASYRATQFWNENFEHFRYYKGKIYDLQLVPDHPPIFHFTQFTVDRFLKEVSRELHAPNREFEECKKYLRYCNFGLLGSLIYCVIVTMLFLSA